MPKAIEASQPTIIFITIFTETDSLSQLLATTFFAIVISAWLLIAYQIQNDFSAVWKLQQLYLYLISELSVSS